MTLLEDIRGPRGEKVEIERRSKGGIKLIVGDTEVKLTKAEAIKLSNRLLAAVGV